MGAVLKPYYEHAGITIYHGDCREILPSLLPVDLVLTDPPYGLGNSWGKGKRWQGNCGKGRLWNGTPKWDEKPVNQDLLDNCILLGENAIVWGGNYFQLPPQKCWLIWDKQANMKQAQAELAWTNLPKTVRIYRKSPLSVFGNHGPSFGEHKQHPTQKPVCLMRWCIEVAGSPKRIADPFMGSGSALVAARELGIVAIGIDAEEKYCEIAAKRLAQEVLPL